MRRVFRPSLVGLSLRVSQSSLLPRVFCVPTTSVAECMPRCVIREQCCFCDPRRDTFSYNHGAAIKTCQRHPAVTGASMKSLETPRLLLRPFTIEDAEGAYREIYSDIEVVRHY